MEENKFLWLVKNKDNQVSRLFSDELRALFGGKEAKANFQKKSSVNLLLQISAEFTCKTNCKLETIFLPHHLLVLYCLHLLSSVFVFPHHRLTPGTPVSSHLKNSKSIE